MLTSKVHTAVVTVDSKSLNAAIGICAARDNLKTENITDVSKTLRLKRFIEPKCFRFSW